MTNSRFKIQKGSGSSFRRYQELVVGTRDLGFLIKYELITMLFGNFPGALGILLRKWTYPWILGRVGRGVLFGHHITLRHPRKIFIGEGVIIDDYVMLDAKGETNRGIELGEGVFIGRQSILYGKNGNIVLEKKVNVGHRCIFYSSNQLTVGEGTMVAADCYLMSGGAYDLQSPEKFCDQDGMNTKGPLSIGSNVWLGAKVVVLDGVSIGENSVIGAGAVVVEPIAKNSIAVGVPAKIIRSNPSDSPLK
ncbi:MAG: acyltransferase [Chlamydiae bacterium]|nr:acyltransferase [Chlamydiota bacterium]MBI3266386.1 acyltransferase [Chlamydiota bacterium]